MTDVSATFGEVIINFTHRIVCHMSLICENWLVSFAAVSLAVSLREQNKTNQKRTKHTNKQTIRHTTNKQLHTGLTSAQGQRNAANWKYNQFFSGLYNLTQVSDFTMDNHKEKFSTKCRKLSGIDLFFLSFALGLV